VVLREWQLSSLAAAGNAAERVKLGRQLRADALVVLSLIADPTTTKREPSLQIVICDCSVGARLFWDFREWKASQHEQAVEDCVQAIRKTRGRFSSGLKRLIGVAPFVSKSLSAEHDYLQSAFAALLGNSLLKVPGVAVIEVEEAVAIERELKLSGDSAGSRLTPLFIEGEFEVLSAATKQAEPKLRLAARWLDGKQVHFEQRHADVTLAEATKLVGPELVNRWLEHEAKLTPELLASAPPNAKNDFDRQRVELLDAQARRFARAGLFDTALALREAALLVEPETHCLRLALLQDYADARSATARKPQRTRAEMQQAERVGQLWADRAVLHAETLLRVRWVGFGESAGVVGLSITAAGERIPTHLKNEQPPLRSSEDVFWFLLRLTVSLDPETPDRMLPGDPSYPPGHPFVAKPAVMFRPIPDVPTDWFDWEACGSKFDVLWNGTNVALMRRARQIEPLFVSADKSDPICGAVWDGQQVWIINRHSGVRAVALDGAVLCHIDFETGLPRWNALSLPTHRPPMSATLDSRQARIHPLGPGKCCVTGYFGEPRKQWFAVLTLGDGDARRAGRCRCDVVHTSTAAQPTDWKSDAEPDVRFFPAWFVRKRDFFTNAIDNAGEYGTDPEPSP
jgi:hypothetical protein